MNNTTTTNVIPTLISVRQILHRASFNEGPRISEIHTIQTNTGLVEVDIWTEGGRVVKVSDPRKI